MLWAILLGCDDFHSPDEMESGRHHRRPSVADMADVAARLKTVAAQMEVWQGWTMKAGMGMCGSKRAPNEQHANHSMLLGSCHPCFARMHLH